MADFPSSASVRPSDPMLDSRLDPMTAPAPDEQFLRLRIGLNSPVLLPMQQLTEVLTILEHQIMPIPHLPAWAMGVYNWRGEMLWMIDLGHLCGLEPWYESPAGSTQAAVVLSLREHSGLSQTLGLVVRQIEDIESCPVQAIQRPPAAIPPPLKPFAAGYWQKSAQESFAILDGAMILQSISVF